MLDHITYSPSLTKESQVFVEHPRRRILIMCGFVIVFFALYRVMVAVAVPLSASIGSLITFMMVWGACFCLYFGASIWVMMTRPLRGPWHWVELAMFLGGAVVFRLMPINLPLELSPDAWRYLWDARVTLHGFSPYLYAPADQALVSLRNIVFVQADYRQIPTEYPPGAQVFFLLGYLLNPTNPVGLKSLFVLLDSMTCAALALLLSRKGLDPRRVVVYAWCPLPIVEFAIAGHSEVIAVSFMVLAALFALSERQNVRLLAGICTGLAVLSRIYPILLLLALLRRRDWGLGAACLITIALGYMPFILLSHGDIRAVLFSFAGQGNMHPGVLDMVPFSIASALGIKVEPASVLTMTHAQKMEVVGITVLLVCIQRFRGRISMEAAALSLFAVVLMAYAHVFPWYATVLLPWIAILAQPVWGRGKGINAKGLAIVMAWYFTCVVTLSYLPGLKQYSTTSNWMIYYSLAFGVMVIGLLVAVMIAFNQRRSAL